MKMPARLPLAAMILSGLALTACTKEQRPRIVLPPADLAVCASEPDVPALPVQDWTGIDAAKATQLLRDTMMLDYVLALRSAWGDCRAKVDGLAAWRAGVGR